MTTTSADVEYGSFTDHGPWVVDPDKLSWKKGLDRVRAAVHASVPELTRYRRVPPVGRMLTTLRALGLPLAVWGARERGKETSTADISPAADRGRASRADVHQARTDHLVG